MGIMAEPESGEPGVTPGERAAGIAGAVAGLLILVLCIDLASGGRLSGALARRGGIPDPADAAADGGCGCD